MSFKPLTNRSTRKGCNIKLHTSFDLIIDIIFLYSRILVQSFFLLINNFFKNHLFWVILQLWPIFLLLP